ncbi:hypothetical protein GCM10011584_13080 [Nocardioides phosphati]|uniref:Transglycosylase SLT domain-containing protein n=1 Tax=Nocardioides phosphati TaxID=1867775 RepID=A0ABQ2N7W7_9ACTN|nr:hypothetical protein GCM10011584_13080 [Nocardioides phosphati]
MPLALLSTAWTASLAGVGTITTASDTRLPDGTQVPIESLEDPASFTAPGQVGLGLSAADGAKIVAAASTNGIPTAALAAYQRAEQVINDADKSCHIDWALIAAIGRVESDHGRYGGNTLDTQGVSHPGIYGPALDGTHQTQAITDTDGGLYDNDKVWDRAVGAMQFIPSTWAKVGVDADGDGKRNPQDIDDAALATAVYLCSGTDDLGTDTGRRSSVYRYNHSNDYVDLVLKIRDAYLQGNYTAVPNYITSAYAVGPTTSSASYAGGPGRKGGHGPGTTGTGGGAAPGSHEGRPLPGPSGGDATKPPAGGDPTQAPKPALTSAAEPIRETIETTTKVVDTTVETVVTTVNGTLGLLTQTQAQLQCGLTYALVPAKKQECLASYGL